MKIVITGGTGFLGQHVARNLRSEGHDVVALGRNSEIGARLSQAGIGFASCDLRDPVGLEKILEGADIVVHSAALVRSWGRIEDFYPTNVLGTRSLLQASLSAGVKRIVNISTASLYFEYRDRLGIRETDPLPARQATAYAETKLQADLELHAAAGPRLSVLSLRPRAVFGPGDTTVFPTVLAAYDAGRLRYIDGGRAQVDFTCVENLVDAIGLAARAPERLRDRVYNITNGEPRRIRDVIEKLLVATGRNPAIGEVSFKLAFLGASLEEMRAKMFDRELGPRLTRYAVGLMSKSQTLDITRAREELGYIPRLSFADGLDRTLEALKNKEKP